MIPSGTLYCDITAPKPVSTLEQASQEMFLPNKYK